MSGYRGAARVKRAPGCNCSENGGDPMNCPNAGFVWEYPQFDSAGVVGDVRPVEESDYQPIGWDEYWAIVPSEHFAVPYEFEVRAGDFEPLLAE